MNDALNELARKKSALAIRTF